MEPLMSNNESSAYVLARMRAEGRVPRPSNPTELATLRAAADRAGRRVCEVSIPGAPPTVTLGWVHGAEPVAGVETGVERTKPSHVLLLTFAAALRACWTDRSEHPFPGVPATEEAILDGVASLGALTKGALEGGVAAQRHRKGALRRLRDAGLLAGQGGQLRLGPAVARWSESQISPLRAVYDQLPFAQSGDET